MVRIKKRATRLFGASHRGFTLIELMVSMGILVVVMLMMARVYTEATNTWQLGSRRIIAATEGRVVMDFLVRELTMAIADEDVTFRTVSPDPSNPYIYGVETYGAEADEIFFVGMVRRGAAAFRRTGNQFCYFVTEMVDEDGNPMPYRYRLVRTRGTRSMYRRASNREQSAYQHTEWWSNQEPDLPHYGFTGLGLHPVETIAENVAAFEIWAWSEDQDRYVPNYQSSTENNLLPVWADIYVELLGEDDAVRAAQLWLAAEQNPGLRAAAVEFVDDHARRYMARVFFTNRERAKSFSEI